MQAIPRLGRTPDRVAGWRPGWSDLWLPALVLAVAVARELFDQPEFRSGWSPAFDVALVLPLVFRRRWPAQAFSAVAAVAFVQWATGILAAGDLAVLVALYSVAAYDRRRSVLVGAVAVAQVGALLAILRWSPAGHGITGFVLITGTLTAAWVMGVNVRTRRAYLESVLERAATAERERDHQTLLATATERTRISREMHDIVAHSLSVMIALSDGAAASVSKTPEEARQAMVESSTLGRQALGEVRRLLGTTPALEGSQLAPAPGLGDLDKLVAQVRATGLHVDLTVTGKPLNLPPAAQLTVYRMVQEGLTNVLKHAASATRVTVAVDYSPDGMRIAIDNDEQPPPAGSARAAAGDAEPGQGLTGMRERAALFHGSVEAGPVQGGGWRLTTRLRFDDEVSLA